MDMFPKRRRSNGTPGIEPLEARALPSGTAMVLTADTIHDAGFNDTADQAQQLGLLRALDVTGAIDRQGTDVDWYAFDVEVPTAVSLGLDSGTLSLFNDATGGETDPFTFGPHRLLVQVTASGGNTATLHRELAPGRYLVALSAVGNRYFQPFVADSGLPGPTTTYSLSVSGIPLNLDSTTDPRVLSVDASAIALRFNLSGPLSFVPDVELFDGNGQPVAISSTHVHLGLSELRLIPATPLASGDYSAIIRDGDGQVRLMAVAHVDLSAGAEPVGGNDTPATAIELGAIDGADLIQFEGVIGDDPFYQLLLAGLENYAGNDVDLYHFRINLTEPVGLRAEVFAGRIGSPLDAGISLYRLNAQSGHLELVVGLNQSYNMTPGTMVSVPLYFDPAVTAGLTAGDYYLAVSNGANTTSPLERQTGGPAAGLFDPEQSHSGSAGSNVGRYVVNLQAVAIPNPPQVTSVSIAQNEELSSAPTHLRVAFNEFIDLTGLAFQAFQQTSQSSLASVFVIDGNGHKFFPRLTGFDPQTLQAEFLMLDRLAPGSYELHLSGALGLKNVIGSPLIGNSEGGDYVVRFAVAGLPAGTAGNPLLWSHAFETTTATTPQNLGVLFPYELQAGVEITRTANLDHARDNSDAYRFTILQDQSYFFHLGGDQLPRGVQLNLVDAQGNLVWAMGQGDGRTLTTQLSKGTYTLSVGDWSPGAARRLEYSIDIALQGNHDNAPPLWTGPAPAVGIRLAGPSVSTPSLPSNGGTSGAGQGGIRNPGSGGSNGNSSSNGNSTAPAITVSDRRPGYLQDTSGLSRINLPDASGNVVIAIPNLSPLAGGSPKVFRASRSIKESGLSRDVAVPGGLGDLADGLVGKSNMGMSNREGKLAGGSKLGNLLESALSAPKEEPETQQKVAEDAPPRSEQPPAADQDLVANDAPAPANNGEAAAAPPTTPEQRAEQAAARAEKSRKLMELLSMDLKGDSGQGPVIAVLAVDSASLLKPDQPSETPAELDIPRALKYCDKVFAGGLGLLLSGLAAPRPQNQDSTRSVHGKGTRTEGRWCPSRQHGTREDTVW